MDIYLKHNSALRCIEILWNAN